MCAARKGDAAKLSSLGCQRNDGEAKQAFVRRLGGGGGGVGGGGGGGWGTVAAISWWLCIGRWAAGGGAACLLCVAEDMSQSYKLTGD